MSWNQRARLRIVWREMSRFTTFFSHLDCTCPFSQNPGDPSPRSKRPPPQVPASGTSAGLVEGGGFWEGEQASCARMLPGHSMGNGGGLEAEMQLKRAKLAEGSPGARAATWSGRRRSRRQHRCMALNLHPHPAFSAVEVSASGFPPTVMTQRARFLLNERDDGQASPSWIRREESFLNRRMMTRPGRYPLLPSGSSLKRCTLWICVTTCHSGYRQFSSGLALWGEKEPWFTKLVSPHILRQSWTMPPPSPARRQEVAPPRPSNAASTPAAPPHRITLCSPT